MRLALLPAKGFVLDVRSFESWALALAGPGPRALYAGTAGSAVPPIDYPPGYAYVLWATGLFATHVCGCATVGSSAFAVLIKVPPVFADFVVAALLGRIAARVAGGRAGFVTFAAAVLAPPLWLVSAYWGQVDSVPLALFAGAVLAMLEGSFVFGWALLALTVLTKPQAAVAIPLLLVWEIRSRGATAKLALAAAAGLAIAYLTALPFAPAADPAEVLEWLFERYAFALAKAPHGSEGAFDLFGIFGFFTSDAAGFAGVTERGLGIALVGLAIVAAAAQLWQRLGLEREVRERERALLFAAFLTLVALFMFATRMHERYILPGLAIGAAVAAFDRRALRAELVFAANFVVNCAYVLAGFNGGRHHPLAAVIGHVLSAVNVATLLALAFAYARSANEAAERPAPRERRTVS